MLQNIVPSRYVSSLIHFQVNLPTLVLTRSGVMGFISARRHPRFWCFQLFVKSSRLECNIRQIIVQTIRMQ